jgi:hypothetical protein
MEEQAQAFAGALIKELTCAQQQRTRAQQQHREEQAERERCANLSPEQREQEELKAEIAELKAGEARHQQELADAALKEQARQRHGGSLDSLRVILTVVAFKSFLFGALILALYSYIDIYKLIRLDHGDFSPLSRWAGPPICLCLYLGVLMQQRVTRIYRDFDKPFDSYRFLFSFLFSAPAVALSGLFLLEWLINKI